VPVKSITEALGLPAGELRGPYRSMEGNALKSGLEIVKKLGFVEKYNFL
jgi:4-hydroxy-tetrahydrodipicolinate synthase